MSIRNSIAKLSGGLAVMGLLSSGAFAQQASITLQNSDVVPCWTHDNIWGLTKTVTGNTIANGSGNVQWTVSATKTSGGNHYVLHGILTVKNTGTSNATIGNIVIDLQKKNGSKWQAFTADVANSFAGDAATSAKIVAAASEAIANQGAYSVSGKVGTFTENANSGPLEFTDVNSNTIWAITPQQVIAPGQTVVLRYDAEFNAAAIAALPTGTVLRVEAIVSFGNAGLRGGSGATESNIDISGNGALEVDERNVRSVPSRFTLPGTPAGPEECNDSAIVTDEGVETTGTVFASAHTGFDQFPATITSNASWNVSVHVEGGVDGGMVCNDANLVSEGDGGQLLLLVNGGFEQPALPFGTWNVFASIPGWTTTSGPGIEVQNHVAGDPHGGAQHIELDSHGPSWFAQVASNPFTVQTLRFWHSPRPGVADNKIDVYLNGALIMTVDADGTFNGNTVWTEYSYSFISGLPNSTIEFRDMSVADSLGGYLDDVSMENPAANYVCCDTQELSVSSCVPVGSEGGGPGGGPETYTTYSQGGYQGNGVPGQLLLANFATLFSGGLTIGVADGVGAFHNATWTNVNSLRSWIGGGGPSGALTADTLNAPSSAGGTLAKQTAALTINVVFSGAGVLPSGFGGLYYHNGGDSLDGMTVSQILGVANTALGTGALPSGYTFGTLNDLVAHLVLSYDNGNVSTWAVLHLSNVP